MISHFAAIMSVINEPKDFFPLLYGSTEAVFRCCIRPKYRPASYLRPLSWRDRHTTSAPTISSSTFRDMSPVSTAHLHQSKPERESSGAETRIIAHNGVS